MNFVNSPEPIEKSLQFMIVRADVWFTTTVLALGLAIVAAPPATVPPDGLARTIPGNAAAIANKTHTTGRTHPQGDPGR